jgi:hypothetical protein
MAALSDQANSDLSSIAGLFTRLKAGQRKWLGIGERFDRTQDSLQKDATVVARRSS